jgi:hypothetical protein
VELARGGSVQVLRVANLLQTIAPVNGALPFRAPAISTCSIEPVTRQRDGRAGLPMVECARDGGVGGSHTVAKTHSFAVTGPTWRCIASMAVTHPTA